jgi:hypothetical protein
VARAVYEGRATFGEDRGTASDHYKRFAKAGHPGYSLEEAEKPPEDDVDDDFEHYMVWYADMRNQQQRGQKYEPVSWEATMAYMDFLRMAGFRPTAFDVDMLMRLDAAWRSSVPKSPEEIRAEQGRQGRKPH